MPIPTVHTMTPAYDVITKLGGKTEVANALALDKSTLSRWCSPKPTGTGGVIPQQHWPRLIALAKTKKVRLGLKELSGVEA